MWVWRSVKLTCLWAPGLMLLLSVQTAESNEKSSLTFTRFHPGLQVDQGNTSGSGKDDLHLHRGHSLIWKGQKSGPGATSTSASPAHDSWCHVKLRKHPPSPVWPCPFPAPMTLRWVDVFRLWSVEVGDAWWCSAHFRLCCLLKT